MKKKLAVTAILTAAAAVMPSVSFAATTNYVSTDKPVKADEYLTGSNAPILTIEANEDLIGSSYFTLSLENAEWLYEGTGVMPNMEGVTYTVFSDNLLGIQIDPNVFDASSNDIQIPLYTQITSQGAATVTIDPKESGVSEGVYTFAHVNFPGMTINVSDIDNVNGTFTIKFKDEYPYQMPNTKLFKVQITNGFIFESFESAEGTGKYTDIVNFKIDPKDPSTAYVETTSPSASSAGTMTITGVQVASSSKTEEGRSAYLTIEPAYGDGSMIKYELQNFKSHEEAKEYSEIEFIIGKNYYILEGDMVITIEDAPFVDANGRTMLPLRVIANAFDIPDSDIIWSPSAQTVTIKNKLGKTVTAAIGSNIITVDGVESEMDTKAVIKNGRTYLPVRPVLNSLGVDDSDIIWDSSENKITVNYRY